jgi:hypothetical protein
MHSMSDFTISERESNPNTVKPFGRYGVGVITEHPAGLLVVAGVVLMTLEAIPESRAFLTGALAVGGVFGLFLWLHHR